MFDELSTDSPHARDPQRWVYLTLRPWPSPGEPGIVETKTHLVLCVDDEVVGLRVRKILLERAGYQVLTAIDGHAGLELFSSHPVEAVVLDYAMPGMHGGEVAKRMRQAKPDVPILLLSAYVGLPDEVRSLVDVYMTKGEGAPALLDKLGNLISLSTASHPSAGTVDG
jgi:CheY-like chemotaxis protein